MVVSTSLYLPLHSYVYISGNWTLFSLCEGPEGFEDAWSVGGLAVTAVVAAVVATVVSEPAFRECLFFRIISFLLISSYR